MNARIATPADDELLVSLVMHPSVTMWAPDGIKPSFKPSALTGPDESFAVIVEDKLGPVGCFTLYATERAAYNVHTNLLPTCRGGRAIEAAGAALELVFTTTDAEHLVSMVPDCNPAALWFAHAMGFRNAWKRKAAYPHRGTHHDAQYLRMDVDDWIQRLTMCELGQTFHEALVAKGGHVDHVKDPMHDAYVGAAWAMTAGGQINKGIRIYGRWARGAGYVPATVLSEEPLRIDIGSCVLRVVEGEFQIEEEHA